MTPEYLESLADDADPDQLWRLSGLDQMDLPVAKRRQLDAGVATQDAPTDASHRPAVAGQVERSVMRLQRKARK